VINSLPQPLRDDMIPAILALNNAHAVELSPLTAAQLEALLDEAFYAQQIGDGAAFLLAFDQGATYKSPNYLWFRRRYREFVYIDRVVVSPPMRGRGYARTLYMNLFAHARQEGHSLVVCEVNRDPPNRVSDAFHATMQFTEVGHATIHPRTKTVRYLAREL
jgi:predicted GNAT superfamily acetyltransferase